MFTKDDMLGAIFMVTVLHPFKKLEFIDGYYIVSFEDTTATLSIPAELATKKEILATIKDAQS